MFEPTNRIVLSFLTLGLVVLFATQSPAQDIRPVGELAWKNGDKMPGQIESSDGKFLTWHSNLFRDPLEVDQSFLDQVAFDADKSTAKTEEVFSIQTVDGFSLYGEVKKLDDESLVVASKRFGEVHVKRSEVATILNLKNSGSLVNGEFDLSKWDSNRNEKKYWQVNDQGHLESLRTNVHIFLKSDLPESSLIEVELEWEKKLDFTFGFGVPKNSRKIEQLPRLESWDDSIVLSHNDDFEIVMESSDGKSKRLKFLIHWNRKTNILVIHDERGKTLATADIGKPSSNIEPGIYIENKSGDLKLASLMIRRSSTGFDATKPSIQTVNDSAINGKVKSFDGTNWLIAKTTDDESEPEDVEISDDNFCGSFLMNPAKERPSGATRIKFNDGMFVRGSLSSITGNDVELKTEFANEPITFNLSGASSIRFDPAKSGASESFSHRLFNKAGEIQGRLEPGSGSADDVLRWRVAGARSAVPFSKGDARIVLQEKTPIVSVDEKWADTLYLANRDTVPCRIVSMDEQKITVESFFENSNIDHAQVKAVDLRNTIIADTVKPDDSEWVIPKNATRKIKTTDKKMTLSKGAELGHPWLFGTGGFEFELSWQNNYYGSLDCRTLIGDVNSADGGKKVCVVMYGENLFVGDTGEMNPNNGMINVKNGKATIAFKYEKGNLVVTVDGKTAYSEKVVSGTNRGRGVQFKLNDMYGQGIKCVISDLKLSYAQGGNSMVVDEDQKQLLLTIPRLKKSNPPKQILCASNMDMLRGELVSFDTEFVTFRANHEVKRFPREIVSSVVWLHAEGLAKSEEDADQESAKDAKEEPAQDVAEPGGQKVQVLMLGNRRMTAELNSWKDDRLSGNSEALGNCEIPFDQIYELRFGSFATEATDVPYSDWVAKLAPAPNMESGADGQPGSEYVFGSASPLIGTTPTSFSLPMVDGETFSLKDHRGKVVVLDFWATWCGPCVQALPKIKSTIAEFSSEDVVLLAVNQEEGIEQVKSFLETRELDIPVGLDTGKIGRAFKATSIPKTVIIDQNGKIAFVNVGNTKDMEEKLKAAIDLLLDDEAEAEAEF